MSGVEINILDTHINSIEDKKVPIIDSDQKVPATDPDKVLAEKYAPYLMFQSDEKCFPITIEEYLGVCNIIDKSNPPTSAEMFDMYLAGKSNLYLTFKDPVEQSQESIKGDINKAHCYVKVMHSTTNTSTVRLVYYYLFSHTEPYNCCYFGFPMYQYAHRGDLKYICIDLIATQNLANKELLYSIDKIYFGAHGSDAGMWCKATDVIFENTHVIAWPARFDHSFYPKSGVYPRIYFVAWDICLAKNSKLCKPVPIINYTKDDAKFTKEQSGWNYFPGHMNDQGINAPGLQGFWNGNISDKTNNWFLRLCYPDYF